MNAFDDSTAGTVRQPRLVICDDDQAICRFIAEVAGPIGYTCHIANSADEFRNVLSGDVSLIMMDLVMPGTDGIELLRFLNAEKCKASLVLMSGMDKSVLRTAENLARELGLNVISWLQKPFRLKELQNVFDQCMHFMAPAGVRTVGRRPNITKEDIERALDRGEFIVKYQPQVEIRTGRMCGMEALVRWQHPKYRLVGPDQFIPAVESFGLIDELTTEVLNCALTDWQNHLYRMDRPSVSVNISVKSLSDLTFPDRVARLLGQFEMPPAKLVMEITESGLVQDLAHSLDILARLRMKGIRLSIDDFGTGFSMLKQLRQVPATELKIDKSFVQDMLSDTGAGAVSSKTIELGHDLGMQVVAEGVETQGQLNRLNNHGCDIAQGYLFSRPVSTAELLTWYRAHDAASGGTP